MAAGAVIAILVAIIIYYLQKTKKKIAYRVRSAIDLLTSNERLEGKVKVLYEGVEVENIQVLELKVFNGGNSAIVKSDFEGPLKIRFPNTRKILSAQLVSATPVDLAISFATGRNELLIDPLLLNRKDAMQFKIILSGDYMPIEISGRIKDVVKIKGVGYYKALISSTTKFLFFTGLIIELLGQWYTNANGVELGRFMITISGGLFASDLLEYFRWRNKERRGEVGD